MSRPDDMYNEVQKDRFLKQIPKKTTAQNSRKVFHKTYQYETMKDKDLLEFSEDEILEMFYRIPVLLRSNKEFYFSTVNSYRSFYGKTNITIPSEQEYKQNLISDRAFELPWVMNDVHLLQMFKKACESDIGYNGFVWGHYKMAALYMLLRFYGLTDEEILSMKRDKFLDNFVLPNHKVVDNFEIRQFITDLCEMATFLIKAEDGRIRNLRFYLTDQLIRPWDFYNKEDNTPPNYKQADTQTLTRIKSMCSQKFTLYPMLYTANIDEAGRFNACYTKDIINNNTSLALTRSELNKLVVGKKDKNENVSAHGLTLIEEEKYQIYKAYRMKMFATV